MPDAVETHRETSAGRMRSRHVGDPHPEVPEVVVVQGMAVADYLMPAVAVLGRWTRAHLVELPGFAGSGEPTRRLDVAGYASAVTEWLAAAKLGPIVLVGHSSGTQVAARAAACAARSDIPVVALVLASPTVAPIARPLPRLLLRWQLDGRHEPPGLTEWHLREWRRAGLRGLLHLVRVHLRDRIEDTLPDLALPVLVLRGTEDRLTTTPWARGLADAVAGRYQELPGAHTLPCAHPAAWSEPIRHLALDAARARRTPPPISPPTTGPPA
jgi:pimeloyl-ACP methyl ester carboxylesterase